MPSDPLKPSALPLSSASLPQPAGDAAVVEPPILLSSASSYPSAASYPSSASNPSSSSAPGGRMVDEATELRARVQHLEQTQQEMRQRHLADLKALRQSQHLLNAILDNSTTVIYVKDLSGRYILVNRRHELLTNRPRSETLGKTAHELLPQALADRLAESDRAALSSGEPVETEEEVVDAEGNPHTFLTIKFPLTDPSGAINALCGISTEITERKRATEERAALQQQIIETQRAALRELSTPLIPLADGVLVVPLIGSIDRARAQQIVEAMLDGVTEQRAHTVIVDITGVRVVDAPVVSGLVQAARATRLLGAEVILTGLRAEVAQTLVRIGAELTGVVTLSTLQAGIAHAMRPHRR